MVSPSSLGAGFPSVRFCPRKQRRLLAGPGTEVLRAPLSRCRRRGDTLPTPTSPRQRWQKGAGSQRQSLTCVKGAAEDVRAVTGRPGGGSVHLARAPPSCPAQHPRRPPRLSCAPCGCKWQQHLASFALRYPYPGTQGGDRVEAPDVTPAWGRPGPTLGGAISTKPRRLSMGKGQ